MGFFGALGRALDVDVEHGVDVVRQSHEGEEYDIDVGVWRLELGTGRVEIAAAAEAIVCMNLDIWAFADVSLDALRQLIELLSALYGTSFEAAAAQPSSEEGGVVRSAVMWNSRTVTGQARRWPREVEGWFASESSAPRREPPGLFEFAPRTASMVAPDAGLVYLRGSRSCVDGLYLPSGASWLPGDGPHLTVAGQALPPAVQALSEQPLIALRASLADEEPGVAVSSGANAGGLEDMLRELSAPQGAVEALS